MTSGTIVTSQCAPTFASTATPSGTGLSISCSRLPSSASARNRPSSASNADSSATTQSTPLPMLRKCSSSGDTASGNSDATIMKNSSGFASSLSASKRDLQIALQDGEECVPHSSIDQRARSRELLRLMRRHDGTTAARQMLPRSSERPCYAPRHRGSSSARRGSTAARARPAATRAPRGVAARPTSAATRVSACASSFNSRSSGKVGPPPKMAAWKRRFSATVRSFFRPSR